MQSAYRQLLGHFTIRNALKTYLDSNDELPVVKLSAEAWTGFNDNGSRWLRANL